MTNTANENGLVVFEPKEVGSFGNKFLGALVMHEVAKEEAELVLAKAEKAEGVIDLQLTRAVLHLYLEDPEKVDIYQIYAEDKKSSSLLYRSILVALGVLKRVITDEDTVDYIYTDTSLSDQYQYSTALKEHDPEEYRKRHSRRNSLNIRLARVVKAAIAMHDAKATPDDIIYRENKETGVQEAVITKGPKSVLGKEKETVIHAKNVKNNEKADFSPTISGLAKAADQKHKPVVARTTAENTDNTGNNGATENDFLTMTNTFLMMVKGREKKFEASEKAALKNVLTILKESGIK